MVTATLVRKTDPECISAQKARKTKTLTKDHIEVTHNFVIKVDIDMEKTSRFLGHLNTYDLMRKAQLSARPKGISIKLNATNEKLSGLVLKGIHEHTDVKCSHILVA